MHERSKLAFGTAVLVGLVLWPALIGMSLLTSRYFAPAPEINRTLAVVLAGTALFLTGAMFGLVLAAKGRLLLILPAIATVSAVLVGYFAYQRYSSGPPFVFERVTITLTVTDVEGREAHLRQEDQLLIQKNGVSVFIQRNIGAPGEQISLPRVEYVSGARLVHQETQMVEEGLYNVMTIVSPPLHSGARVVRTLDFDATAPPSDDDGHILPIKAVTRYVEVNLVMPEGRACKDATLLVDGRTQSSENTPRILDNGLRVTWEKRNPKIGAEYTVMCSHRLR